MLLLALILGTVPPPTAAREETPPAPSQPPAPPQPVLAGTIASEKDDQPLAGAIVEVLPWHDPDAARARRLAGELVPEPLGAATTDAAGAFRVSVPSQQRVLIAVSAPGHARARYRGAFLVGPPGEVRDVGRLTLANGRSVAGTVVDAAGKPIPGATVIALSPREGMRARSGGRFARRFAAVAAAPFFPVTALTGPDGFFTLNGVTEDAVTLRAHATGLAPAVKRDVRANAGNMLSMEQGHSLSGTVVAPDGSTPAANAWVLVGPEGEEGADGLARADAKGAFTLKNLRSGGTSLTATLATVIAGTPDDLPASAHWAPSSAFATKLPLPSGAAPARLKLRPGGIVKIHTIDVETREPVAGSLLVLEEPGDSVPRPATSGPSGGATFTGVSAGSLEARGDAAGYLTEDAATVNLAAGESRSLSIALRRAAALAGTVRDAEGRPVAGATVTVAAPPPFAAPMPMVVYFPIGVPPTSTDAAGMFRLEKLPPRTDLQVSVTFEGYIPWEMSGLKLRPGERREGMEVLLDLGAIVAGRLLDREGNPIEGAAVSAEKQREGSGSEMMMIVGDRGRRMGAGGPLARDASPPTASDGTGAFRVRGLKSGIWTLKIKAKGFAPKDIGGLKLEAAGAGLDAGDIVLEPGVVLTGQVTNAAGSAIPFARGVLRERFAVLSEFTAGSDGSFTTEDMAPGDVFDLTVQAEGYATLEKSGLAVPSEPMSIVILPSSTIRGEVIDEESREPIRDFGIAVSRTRAVGGGGMQFNMLSAGPERQFQTDDGTFALEGVDPGSITVHATAPGYKETRLDELKVPEGADLDGIRILMPRAATVSGTVLDDRGRPLPNVEVARKQATQGMMMRPRASGGTTTDGDGRFMLSGLERGPMTLSFTHPEFEDAQADIDTTQDVKNLKVTLSRGTDLAGMVIHEDDGAPVAGAAVTAVAAGASRMGQAVSAKTGPDGAFSLEALSAGRYTLRAEAKGLRPATADDVVIAAGVQPALVELRMGGGVSLTGTITGIDPQDLPRFSVSSVRPGGGFGITAAVDASGRFEMGGLSPGPTTLIARSGILGGRSLSRTVEIPENASTFETTIDFPRGSVVEGTVTRGGEPVDGASVIFINVASRASQTVRTDQAGSYVASDVEDGQYDVTVMQFSSGTSHTTSVAVSGDKRFDIELPLARISGRVTDTTTGKPIDGAQIAIRKLDGEATSSRMGMLLQRGASTDATGTYALEGLDAGTYALTASHPGFGYETQQASIIPGVEPPEISFVLGPTEGLSFTAIDAASGMPLRSLTGLVLVGGGDPLSPGGSGSNPVLSGRWSADASGIFHLDSLQPGRYRMVLGGEGLATKTFHDVEVPASAATFTLEKGGVLEVRAASLEPGQTAMAALVDEAGRAVHFSTFFPEPGFRLRAGEPTVLADLPPGAWRLRVAWPDGRIEETPATIAPGQILRIALP